MKHTNILLCLGIMLTILSWSSKAVEITDAFDASEVTLFDVSDLKVIGDPFNIAIDDLTSVDFKITNNTTAVWNDFHVSTNLPAGIAGFVLGSYSGPGNWIFDPTSVQGEAFEVVPTLDLVNLIIGPGADLEFAINLYCDEPDCDPALSLIFSAYPTTDSIPDAGSDPTGVPEPPLALLFGTGLLAFYSLSRKSA